MQNETIDNLLNRALFMRAWMPKTFALPQDIIKDEHLTNTQKKFVLETMLRELQDPEDAQHEVVDQDFLSRKRKSILKARSSL